MRKIRNLVIGGIENKVLNLILVTVIILAAAFFSVTAYNSSMLAKLTEQTNQKQLDAITSSTAEMIDQVVDGTMARTTQLGALITDELFDGLGVRVNMLGEYAGKLFSGDVDVRPVPYKAPDPEKEGEVRAQLILADGVKLTPHLKQRLGIAANMSDMMISLFGASDVTNSCFIALPEGAFLVADDRPRSKYDESGEMISYDPRTRPWYQQAVEAGELIFTDTEIDAFTGDIGIVCAMPVYRDGKLVAVVGSDLFLTSMQAAIQASDSEGGFQFVVNQNGHVVFSPKTEGILQVEESTEALDLRQSGNEDLSALVSDALKAETQVRHIDLDDGSYYMVGSPMGTVGWALISAYSEQVAAQPITEMQESYEQIQQEAVTTYRSNINRSRNRTLLILLLILLVLLANALILGKKIVKPLNSITQRIFELNESNLEFKMEDTFRTGDEIQTLAESFADLSHKTVVYMDQVRNVTAEKERIGTELRMANQIQESVLPNIFPAFPDREEFDIYATMDPAKEVGGDFYDFFLIDKDRLGIVIADVSGKGVPAALFMMASKIILQSCAMLGRSPAEILTRTNEAICSNNRMEMFVTVWFGILDLKTGLITGANAGHEYPAVKRGEGYELFKTKHGMVIGAMENVTYSEYRLQLQPGDRLFLYTDGLPEATDASEEMFGVNRVLDVLNENTQCSVTDTLVRMTEAVSEFVDGAEQFDDLTMLCLEYKGRKVKKEDSETG